MIDDIKKDARERMGKSIEALKNSLGKVRTGRAHPSLLDHLSVDYYGSEVPISQVANIAVEDARTLSITPWEKPMIQVKGSPSEFSRIRSAVSKNVSQITGNRLTLSSSRSPSGVIAASAILEEWVVRRATRSSMPSRSISTGGGTFGSSD